MLTIMAANHGEGAYEAELVVRLPPEADYNGMERRREVNCINHVWGDDDIPESASNLILVFSV